LPVAPSSSFTEYGIHLCSRRRRHKFRPNWIGDSLDEDAVDLSVGSFIEGPSDHRVDRLELIGVACTPERRSDALIEHPPHGQMDHAPSVAPLRQAIEPLNCSKISSKARRLKFGILEATIVARKFCVGAHSA
jgi:hypothetical protein